MAFPIDDDTFCAQILEHDEPVDAQAAYRRFAAQRSLVPVWPRYAVGLGLAAAVLALVLLTPLGTYARNFLTIFEPKQFTAIDVSSVPKKHDVRLELNAFGTVHSQRMPITKVPLSHNVDAIAGFHVLTPSYLPSHLPPNTNYNVMSRANDAFTFSASKARASEARLGNRLPPVPPALDGTTVTLQFGPVVERRWGPSHDEFALAIEQMPAPIVRSSGATLAQLEKYLLQMPNVSPELAAQIEAIGDPSSTLPVPFRPDKSSAQHVIVQGVQGLAIGDNTGAGATVMWQARGMLYFVAGPLREDEVLKIANGLR